MLNGKVKNILNDLEIKADRLFVREKYPKSFRLVRYYDEREKQEFTFLTNTKHLIAFEVAELKS